MPGPRDPEDLDEKEILAIEDDEEGLDAGSDDDEGGDETGDRQDEEDAEAQEGLTADAPKKEIGRAERKILKEREERRAAQEKADRLERELSELRAERSRQETREETPEQEAARLSLMTVEERIDYKLSKATRQHEQQMALVRFESADRSDKASYEAKAAFDPRYKRYGAEVEQLLAAERRQGRDFPRETILKFVLGEKVMANTKSAQKQKDAGRKNVERQQASAGNSRSDRGAARGRSGSGNSLADLEKRLEGQLI